MPSLDGILLNPDTMPVPNNDLSVMYAIMAGLAARATRENIHAIGVYLSRVTRKELSVFCMKGATDRDKGLRKTATFVRWAQENQYLFQ